VLWKNTGAAAEHPWEVGKEGFLQMMTPEMNLGYIGVSQRKKLCLCWLYFHYYKKKLRKSAYKERRFILEGPVHICGPVALRTKDEVSYIPFKGMSPVCPIRPHLLKFPSSPVILSWGLIL
jgi:hypothetical protein